MVMAVGVAIPFTPLGAGLNLTPLPPPYFLWLVPTLLGYAALAQLVKGWYARKYAFD
jgi:P-type Mg2+ transporter